MSRIVIKAAVWVVGGMVASMANQAFAVDAAASGDWSAPGTWTPAEPTALDIANINGGFNVGVTQPGETALRLDVGSVASASGALTIASGTLSVGGANASTPSIRVAQAAGTNGSLTMTGGTVNVTATTAAGGFAIGDLIVADVATSTGTMTQSGGTFTVSDEVFVGLAGNGTLNLSGGTLSTAAVGGRGFLVGFFNGAVGNFNLSGAGTVSGDSVISAFDPGSSATTIQTGGTSTARSFMIIGRQGIAFYTHSAGAITATTGNGDIVIAESGNGRGTYTLSGTGTATTSDDFIVGNAGTSAGLVEQTGGTITVGLVPALGQDYILGAGTTTRGVTNHSAGGMTTTFLGVGTNGRGNYNLSGTGTVTARTLIDIGQNLTATGTNASSLSQSGTSTVTTGGLIVGERGTGSYTISGGTLNVTGVQAVGGTLGALGNLLVGRDGGGTNIGVGTVTQTGGAVNVTTGVFLGDFDDSTGTYSISAGSLTVGGSFNVGGALASNAVAPTGTAGQALGAHGIVVVRGSLPAINIAGNLLANPADRVRTGTANTANFVFEIIDGTGLSPINVTGVGDLDGAVIDPDLFSFTPAPNTAYNLIVAAGGFTTTGTFTTQNTGTGEGVTLAPEDTADWTLRFVPGATAGSEILQAVYQAPEPTSLSLLGGMATLMIRRRNGRRD